MSSVATEFLLETRLEPKEDEFPLLQKSDLVVEARSLDPERYYTREFMDKEWDRMWTRIWNFAGFATDVPDTGDYFTCELGHDSFVFVRGEDDRIRAFYNVCQHRGARLLQSESGSVDECFTCPFHSWQYNFEGENVNVMDRETFQEDVLCGDLGLRTVRCEVFHGMVFYCMDDDAPPLEEFLGDLVEHLAPYDIPGMRVVKDVTVEWPANWKSATDVFYEAYHVHVVHPQITTAMDDCGIQLDFYRNGVSRFLVPFGRISPRADDQKELNEDLRGMLRAADIDPAEFEGKSGEVREAIKKSLRGVYESKGLDCSAFHDSQLVDFWGYNFFPNIGVGVSPDGLLIQRWRPHKSDPERCHFDVITLAHPDFAAASPKIDYLEWAGDVDFDNYQRPARKELLTDEEHQTGLGLVGYQDYVNIVDAQTGMRSRGCRKLRLSDQEARLTHYHDELDRYLDGQK